MGKLYDLIQTHMDSQRYRVSVAQLSRELNVTPTTVANWRTPKRLIAREHLQAIARVTGQPYAEVLRANLADINYGDPSE